LSGIRDRENQKGHNKKGGKNIEWEGRIVHASFVIFVSFSPF
jgi:hypothetical protein